MYLKDHILPHYSKTRELYEAILVAKGFVNITHYTKDNNSTPAFSKFAILKYCLIETRE